MVLLARAVGSAEIGFVELGTSTASDRSKQGWEPGDPGTRTPRGKLSAGPGITSLLSKALGRR